MTVGFGLWAAGMLQFLVAWLFFRLPGQRMFVFAPITRAGQFLTLAGVSLWVGGLLLMLVGMFALAWQIFMPPAVFV